MAITAPSNGVSTVNVPLNDNLTFMQNNTAAANAFNAQQAQKQMDFQVAQNAKAMDFNHRESELNRNWQKMMSDTAHQREIQDLVAAGLNPVLSALGGNGASVGSGSAASITAPQGSRADADNSINASMAGLLGTMISGQTQRDVANINAAASMRNADVSADATKFAASTSYAGLMQQLAHMEQYPTTLFGMLSSIGEGVSSNFWKGFAEALENVRPSWPSLGSIFGSDSAASGSGSSSSGKTIFDNTGKTFNYNPDNPISKYAKTIWHQLTRSSVYDK